MTVRIVLESKEGLCVQLDNIDKIAMSNDMIVLQLKSVTGKVINHTISKSDIRYVKVIPERKKNNDN